MWIYFFDSGQLRNILLQKIQGFFLAVDQVTSGKGSDKFSEYPAQRRLLDVDIAAVGAKNKGISGINMQFRRCYI